MNKEITEITEKKQKDNTISIIKHYYKVLLVASSGSGKTYSAQNLNRETTAFVNVENKPLPFRDDFKYHYVPKNAMEVNNMLIDAAKNPEIDCIYLDSLSAVFEMILEDSRNKFKGFDVWNNYNTTIQSLLNLIKRIPKEMFISAHYEILNIEGAPEKRVKTKGKELEGLIEREFTAVLYGNRRFNERGKPEYFYNLVEDGTSAKCPPIIFGEDIYRIPNDCLMILEAIRSLKK